MFNHTPPNMAEKRDVYTHQDEDAYPGVKQRSRPGAAPFEKIYDRVPDGNGNMVSAKPANAPFLNSRRKREEHQAKVAAAAAARRANPSSGSTWRTILLVVLFLPLLSSFLTKTYTFGLTPYLRPYVKQAQQVWDSHVLGKQERVFTPEELARYDGRNGGPLYLAIGGEVYDVSEGRRMYGEGGSYHSMVGVDASRSFITGCFAEHRTHDLRGLSAEEIKALDGWKSFFANHAKYRKVGRVANKPIDPRSPVPLPCSDPKTQ